MCTSIGPDSAVVVTPTPWDSSWENRRRRCSQDKLGGVDGVGELQQCVWHVVADDLVVGAAEAFHQDPLPGQVGRVAAYQAVAGGDVDGQQVGALGVRGDAGGAADQGVAFRAAGQRDHHPLARLPGPGDAMVGAVAFELLVDLVG